MSKNIKAVVLDVDGVINGSLDGINSPQPHKEVLESLRILNNSGIPVILCTAKGVFPILETVENAELNNYHIIDNGSIIYNPSIKDLKIEGIENDKNKDLIEDLIELGDYFEVYTAENYYVPKSKISKKHHLIHKKLMQKDPIEIESFDEIIDSLEVSKIMNFSEKEIEDPKNKGIFEKYSGELQTKWTNTPILPGINLLVFTKLGVSKGSALEKISILNDIELEEFLGVGDNVSDWSFMNLCGYVGAMGNSPEELFDLVKIKGENKYAIGGHVDHNGLLDIFKYFELI